MRKKLKALLKRLKNALRLGDLHYINGPQTLPEPLGRAEEEALLCRLAAGETQVREELIVHNLRLVVYIAKKFESAYANVEDLISIGTIGLIKAVQTFRPEKKIKLATYASRCIENEILMFLRKTGAHRTDISFDEPLNVDWDGNELLLSDILGSGTEEVHEGLEQDDERRTLLRAVQELPARERTIMRLRFGLDGKPERTQKEVADLLGISQSYISRLEKRILARLRSDLEKIV